MSDNKRLTGHAATALMHAGEVAQWVVVLLGWVWLGEQGMRFGWSMASGLLPVALWWAVRTVCRGSAWAFQCSPRWVGLAGFLTASGVGLLGWLPSTFLSQVVLLGLAIVWGVWHALTETRTHSSTFQLGSVAWHPVIAAVCVALGWQTSDTAPMAYFGAIVLLAVCAGLLYINERYNLGRKRTCHGVRTHPQTLLAPSAMGLMMGSLWLTNAWCVGLGWRTEQMVLIHLSFMAGLPALMAAMVRSKQLGAIFYPHHTHFSLILLSLGALALLGDGPIYSVLTMLLPSLSWAVHCARPRFKNEPVDITSPWLVKSLALLIGPVLLAWVGVLSPRQGPLAVQTALALLGALAFTQLLYAGWHKEFMHAGLSSQPK